MGRGHSIPRPIEREPEIGRNPDEIEITSGSLPTLDEVKRPLGVARFVLGPPGFTPDDATRGFEKLANELIAKL